MDNLLKIAWITSHHTPLKGGMANSSQRIVRSLWQQGHDVIIIHLVKISSESSLKQFKKDRSNDQIITNWNRIYTTGINCSSDRRILFIEIEEELKNRMIIGFGGF